jgi:hypothetical protein
MRFPQLAIGRRFRYQGKIYRKTGPLTASDEDTGQNRLIMKSTEVTPLDAAESVQETKQRFSRADVEALCSRFRSELRATILERAGPQSIMTVRDLLELIEAQALSVD